MSAKSDMDTFGAGSLVVFFLILAVNQVVIKLTNEGLQPVFGAGLRSLGAVVLIGLWMLFRRIPFDWQKGTIGAGILSGLIFAAEFICLFIALDLTSVARVSIIFYSMPVWMALMAHFLLPGERLTPVRTLGLTLAFAGVVWAILDRAPGGGEASLIGDLAALGAAWGWMGVSLAARVTPIVRLTPEMQIFWQVLISAPVLIFAALFFGPFVRDLQPVHGLTLGFQIVAVASFGYLFWFWLLKRYKASSVSSFAFLSPIFGVIMGWLWLNEQVTATLIGQLALVSAGIAFINRKGRRPQGS